MPETPEYNPNIENENLLYVISHTWKHYIASAEGANFDTGKNERAEIQEAAASVLWTLRDHPHYLSYPNATEQKLSDLLGAMPNEPKIIGALERGRGEGKIDDLYGYSRLAQSEEYNDKKGTTVKIPEMDDMVRRGLLTDIVSVTGKKILSEAMRAPHYERLNEIMAERAGVSVEDLRQYSIARLNYGLYTIGFLLPHMKDGTDSANFIEKKQNLVTKIDDPIDYVKKNFGLEINV